jgi:hypothetical protein
MSLKTRSCLLALALLLVACGSDAGEETTITVGRGAETALGAVERLVEDLGEPDFGAAASLAVPDQAALASLAESATFGEVAEALTSGDASVAANFWAGFAQGSGSFLAGDVSLEEGETITVEDVEYHIVQVVAETGDERPVYVRDLDGFRVDIFASFGAGLAARMIQPVERLLTTESDDAKLILDELTEIAPSLLVAANQPGVPPGSVQEILQLVELVTRVG